MQVTENLLYQICRSVNQNGLTHTLLYYESIKVKRHNVSKRKSIGNLLNFNKICEKDYEVHAEDRLWPYDFTAIQYA